VTRSPLTALLISDGKPGHYHQAEGVIAALGRLRPVTTTRLEVRRRFIVPTRGLLHLVNAGASPSLVLRVGYRIRREALPRADLVVSAGGETLAANATAAKALGVPNIFCGRLRQLSPAHVRLVLVSLERFAQLPNHLLTLPPSPFDVARPPANGHDRARRFGPGNPPARVGVLIGGNSGAFRYAPGDWQRLTRFLREAHREHGMRWLATTSRRSDAVITRALTELSSEPDGGIERFIDYRTAGPGTVAEILAAADAILCTDDSSSMLTEAVGACLPVVSVSPQKCTLEPREAEYRATLTAEGWYRALPLTRLTPAAFLAALGEIAPRSRSQLDELATAVSGRLPELFAPP
jgi:mitochondrial fission protein ELM1